MFLPMSGSFGESKPGLGVNPTTLLCHRWHGDVKATRSVKAIVPHISTQYSEVLGPFKSANNLAVFQWKSSPWSLLRWLKIPAGSGSPLAQDPRWLRITAGSGSFV